MAIDIAHREFVPIFAFQSEPPAPLQAFEEEALEGNKNQNNAALLRPKSSPSVAHSNKSSTSQIRRPKTAHPNLRQYECDRVYQVEHEPTRRHKMENHLPLQRNRHPPWQKSLDGQMSTLVVAPGYILSRSKSKYNMTIKTEEFFDGHQNEEKQRLKFVDPEKDALIGQLQQQINDLTLYLEEERMNHRQSRFKGNQALKDKAEELEKLHQEKIKKLDEEHEQELEEQHAIHSKEFGKYRTAAESQINRMKSETEFLQGAFDSYKGTLHTEMDERWKKKEDEFRQHHEEIKQQALHELKTKLISERNAERVSLQKEGQKHVEAIRRENKKELDALQKRFSNAAADLERLKNVQSELKDLKTEHEVLQMRYEETVSQLKKASNELTDTRVRLLTFEEQFEDKVGEVDDKYKQMMHELMSQNTELRRLYVKKCGELFDEKALSEKTRIDKLRTAKETMQTLTEIRNRSQISLVGGLPPTPESATPTRHQKFTEMSEQQRRRERRNNPPRPVSAPMTKTETKTAVQNAGEMDDLKRPEDLPIRPQSSLPATRPDVEEMRQQLFELQNLSLSDKLFEALG